MNQVNEVCILRTNEPGIVYGEPIPLEDARWELAEEISEGIANGEMKGYTRIGGQGYFWTIED